MMNLLNRKASPTTQLSSFKFAKGVTPEDVFYAYRLILQREPDPRGWDGWVKQLSNLTLASLARMFLTCTEYRGRFQAGARPVLVQLDGFKLYVRPSDWQVGAVIIQRKTYEPHVAAALRHALKPGMTFLDIGANIGYFTMMAASIVGPMGQVIAFEPNIDNCGLIHLSVYANQYNIGDRVRLYPYAVSDQEQLLLMEPSHGSSNGDTLPLDKASEFSTNLVQAVRVDDLLISEPRIDVMKIDIEGNEMLALRGMTALIQRHKPLIFTEFFPSLLQRVSGVTAEQYLDELRAFGYEVYVLDNSGQMSKSSQSNEYILHTWQSLPDSYGGHLDLLLKAE